ncbi:MAG: AAA family ATPase [bacterium]
MKHLALVGKNGSGKSSVCQYLVRSHGYRDYSLSDVLRVKLQAEGLPLTREHLTVFSNSLKEKEGPACLALHCYDLAVSDGHTRFVFDSIRHPEEVRYLKSKGVFFIAIRVDLKQRYERIKKRKRDSDFVDFSTFKDQDDLESSGASSGQHLDACLDACDFSLDNSMDLLHLETQIDTLLHSDIRQ